MQQVGDMSRLKVLVTGACGFIGTNLVTELLTRGASVTALDVPEAAWDRLPPAIAVCHADLMDPASFAQSVAGFDVVYHLAARTDLDGSTIADYAVNTDGTRNLLTALAASGGTTRFVHYSTQLVVGLFDEARFIDETEPYRTRTPYGASKIESERIVSSMCATANIAYTIIRPTSVYGPWGAEPYLEFFRSIKRRRYVHVGEASNLVSLVHVANLVDLTLLLSMHPGAANETFFANDFHPYTMREVVDVAADYYGVAIRTAPVWLVVLAAHVLGVFKALGLRVPLYPFRLRNMRMTYCYDVQKSVRLGYDPVHDIRSGVRDTLDWYESRGWATR